MVAYAPALLAMALSLDGIHIFKEPKTTLTGPYLSYIIFMVAILIFVTHLDVYPRYFRKIWWCGNMVLQFISSQLMFEYLLSDFWFPLEESFLSLVTHTVEILDQWDQMEPMKNIIEILKNETTSTVCSYLLSSFFLLAALHATKVIDFTILDCGVGPFMHDIYNSAEGFFLSSLLNLFTNNTCPKSRKLKCPKNSCKKKDFDETDEDDDGGWKPAKKFGRRRH